MEGKGPNKGGFLVWAAAKGGILTITSISEDCV